MSKKNKRNVLNQIIEEPAENTQEVVEKEVIQIDMALLSQGEVIPDIKEEPMTLEELVAQEEFINEIPEELEVEEQKELVKEFWDNVEEELEKEPVVKVTFQEEDKKDLDEKFGVNIEEEIEEIIQVVSTPRTIASLSRDEYRHFLRTGVMPK